MQGIRRTANTQSCPEAGGPHAEFSTDREFDSANDYNREIPRLKGGKHCACKIVPGFGHVGGHTQV
jgi:hypothetical protein